MRTLPQGQYIKHVQYGLGVVTQSDAERTSIDPNPTLLLQNPIVCNFSIRMSSVRSQRI